MMHEMNDNQLDEMICQAIDSGKTRFDARSWLASHGGDVRLLESWKTQPAGKHHFGGSRVWRTIMHNRARIAVGIVCALAVLFAGYALLGRTAPEGSLFAQSLKQLQTHSYTFDMEVSTTGTPAHPFKGMVLEPGKVRLDDAAMEITTVFDVSTRKSVVLFNRFKAGYRFDGKQERQGPQGILTIAAGSIQGLWDLHAGNERKLGRKEIDGQAAEGFSTTHKTDLYEETITVWTSTASGTPLRVEISGESRKDKSPLPTFILSNFQLDPKLDEGLFSTEMPQGYALADSVSLDTLAARTTSTGPSPEADKVLLALELWSKGQSDEAIDRLLAVNWTARMDFPAAAYLFVMTEPQYASLKMADQQKVMPVVIQQLNDLGHLGREMTRLGDEAVEAKDFTKAENYFSSLLGLGRLLNREGERMLIVRTRGMAIQRLALTSMIKLYEATGKPEQAKAAKEELDKVNRQVAEVRQIFRGTSNSTSPTATQPPTK